VASNWNEADHPRGPGGKFTALPGSPKDSTGSSIVSGDRVKFPNGVTGTVTGGHDDGFGPRLHVSWDDGSDAEMVQPDRVTKLAPEKPKVVPPKPVTGNSRGWPFNKKPNLDAQLDYAHLHRESDAEYLASGYQVKEFKVSDLTPTQDPDDEGGDIGGASGTGGPLVVKGKNGELLLMDGHHRASKAGKNGKIEAWVPPDQRSALGRWLQIRAKAKKNSNLNSDPDGDNLHEYWTRDPEGLAKWAETPHPWTALYTHLKKYIKNDNIAKATASRWYHDVFGHWPGDKDAKGNKKG